MILTEACQFVSHYELLNSSILDRSEHCTVLMSLGGADANLSSLAFGIE